MTESHQLNIVSNEKLRCFKFISNLIVLQLINSFFPNLSEGYRMYICLCSPKWRVSICTLN